MTNSPLLTSTIDSYLANAFSKIRISIVALQNKWFNEESYKGTSKIPYKVSMYYMAIYLVLLMYLEMKAGYNTTWSYYQTKYDIDTNRKKLACCGIDLDDIISSFGISTTTASCVQGIGSMEIEDCLEVEPIELKATTTATSINVSTYLSIPNECFNYIN